MNIEDLIKMHNQALDREVNNNPFLSQRLKNGLTNKGVSPPAKRKPGLLKPVVLYSAIFVISTWTRR